jgi:hypothetical protein
MAARRNRSHQQVVRDRIQTSQLVVRLQNQALGRLKHPMTRDQLRAAEILLRKSLPDLQQVQVTGEDGGPLLFKWQD